MQLYSCAQIVGPTGGAKDVTPPKIVKEYPANKTSNFSAKKITITFNEYIQLKEVDNQLIISPPLTTKPTIVVNGKTLEIELIDNLDPNTTYTFHFGNSITDNHEGNVFPDYQYVLSTGNKIDSLLITGKIQQAFNNQTEAGISVCLYDANSFTDSIIYKQKPLYYSKTLANGSFNLYNLPNKTFQIVAFKDENKNLKYDKNEVVAFAPSSIQPIDTVPLKTLLSYNPNPYSVNRLLDTVGKERGRFYFTIYKPTEATISSDSKSPIFTWNKPGKNNIDTVILFNAAWDTASVVFNYKTPIIDTIFSLKPKKTAKKVPFEVSFKKELELSDSFIIHFNQPYQSFRTDTSKLVLKEDTIIVKPTVIQYDKRDMVKLYYPLKEKTSYTLLLKDSAIKDIYSNYNKKITNTFQTKTLKDYSTLLLNITHPKDGNNYIIQLLTDDESKIYKEFIVTKTTALQLDYLLPGKYKVKIIKDVNKNNRWDTGDYFAKQFPESVYYYAEPIVLRAYWDLEQTINLPKIVN